MKRRDHQEREKIPPLPSSISSSSTSVAKDSPSATSNQLILPEKSLESATDGGVTVVEGNCDALATMELNFTCQVGNRPIDLIRARFVSFFFCTAWKTMRVMDAQSFWVITRQMRSMDAGFALHIRRARLDCHQLHPRGGLGGSARTWHSWRIPKKVGEEISISCGWVGLDPPVFHLSERGGAEEEAAPQTGRNVDVHELDRTEKWLRQNSGAIIAHSPPEVSGFIEALAGVLFSKYDGRQMDNRFLRRRANKSECPSNVHVFFFAPALLKKNH